MKYLFVAILFSSFLHGDPWGKDCDLISRQIELKCDNNACTIPEKKSPLSSIFEGLISFHQKYTSPATGPQSHHYPSSSRYMRAAIKRYGFLRGYLMGCDRLMRENDDPWVHKRVQGTYDYLKLDPVP